MIDRNHDGIDVGIEIDDKPHPDRTTAAVRYFVLDGERRVYISREDALAINHIDQTYYIREIDRTLCYMRADADARSER